ncbi:MAG: hypothetical protein OJF50_002625 [Nitrospira sp.]|nr:hypothetical protein [Nitrospira sp.]
MEYGMQETVQWRTENDQQTEHRNLQESTGSRAKTGPPA